MLQRAAHYVLLKIAGIRLKLDHLFRQIRWKRSAMFGAFARRHRNQIIVAQTLLKKSKTNRDYADGPYGSSPRSVGRGTYKTNLSGPGWQRHAQPFGACIYRNSHLTAAIDAMPMFLQSY